MSRERKSPKSRSRKQAPTLAGLRLHERPEQTWFSRFGCVVRQGDRVDVVVHGVLVSSWEQGETAARNGLLVHLAKDPEIRLEDLASAFGISSEALRRIRRQYEAQGLKAVMSRVGGRGPRSKVEPAQRRQIESLFAQGFSIDEVSRRLKGRLSRAGVGKVHRRWVLSKESEAAAPCQQPLPLVVEALPATVEVAAQPPAAPAVSQPATVAEPARQDVASAIRVSSEGPSERSVRLRGDAVQVGSADERRGADEPVAAREPRSHRGVQLAGAWLMVAMAAALGFYDRAQALRRQGREATRLRLVLDAAVIALSIGEKCVEGVRRLATSSASALLLSASAPSASWVRRVLGDYCQQDVSQTLHLRQAVDLMLQARRRAEEGRPVVFYVDNHLRPYSGKHKVRLGWRMQDKRATPGNTDYYVHDEDGRPVMRIAVPEHGSLTSFLAPIAIFLRLALGKEARILIAFDRGGAFPEAMAELRDLDVEFVTYERKPYRSPSHRQFAKHGKTVWLAGKGGEPGRRIRVIDWQANLGEGRGRVRRLSLRLRDGHRLNLLAISEEDPAWLIETMSGRWSQENGFKHGVERWGINQLDGRRVKRYSPGTLIPNPARRQLEHKLDVQRAREGEARRQLARLEADAPTRAALEQEVADALARQAKLEAQRPSTPHHAALRDTELKGRLVYHPNQYKLLLDSIRVVLANAEAQLAEELAPYLRRPEEAKKALLNLFKATGDIRVGKDTISIALDPAGTRNERAAFSKLLMRVNRWNLAHPGDPKQRRLCFRVQHA